MGVLTYTTMGCLPPNIVTKAIRTGMGQDSLFNHEHGSSEAIGEWFPLLLNHSEQCICLGTKNLPNKLIGLHIGNMCLFPPPDAREMSIETAQNYGLRAWMFHILA